MTLGTFLLLTAFAYGIGVFWYDLLPAKLAERPWRVAAYPFLGIVLAEGLMPIGWLGPAFGGLHVASGCARGHRGPCRGFLHSVLLGRRPFCDRGRGGGTAGAPAGSTTIRAGRPSPIPSVR